MASGKRKFQVLSVSSAAAERVREIIANSDGEVKGIRVGVKNGGCAGMSYTLDAVHDENPADDKVKLEGGAVYIDPKAVLFLFGTTMDFETTTLKTGFVFRNPNEVSACGCGESVSLKPAELPSEASA